MYVPQPDEPTLQEAHKASLKRHLRCDRQVRKIAVDLISVEAQHRTEFDEEALQRLAESIADIGLLQPVCVRLDQATGGYVLLFGERRFRASQLAGLAEIDCIVADGELTHADILHEQIVENALREDLKPTEKARAYAELMQLEGLNGKQLAEYLRLDPATVSRTIRLIDLPPDIQAKVDRGELAMTRALKYKADAPVVRQAPAKPRKEKKYRTTAGITVTFAARKVFHDSDLIASLKELLARLELVEEDAVTRDQVAQSETGAAP